ncbi:MAG: DUF2065 domain-containing protein [Acidiferrobacterales bacterium]|nr:DUF2065 domain-containing protein [Acidiferrobacterales bacterium]
MSEWQALLAGVGFYLILEGLLPFLNPGGFKRVLLMMQDLPEEHIRKFGAVMLVVGIIVLFSVK